MLLITVCLNTSLVFSQDAKKPPMAPIKMLVTDFENNSRKGEQIIFEGINSGKTFSGGTGDDGIFRMELPVGETYLVKIKSIGDAQEYTQFEIPLLGENEMYTEYELLLKFELPKLFVLDNVHFDSGKATLRKESYTELNELVELMTLKENLKVEIAGHTDNVGDDDSNLALSKARADAVRNYVINKGISEERITAKGYGENYPVDTNDTPQGRQKNRRTEVRILQQ